MVLELGKKSDYGNSETAFFAGQVLDTHHELSCLSIDSALIT